MQLLIALSALALLLSDSAFAAVPYQIERDDSGWSWPWTEKRHSGHHKAAYPPPVYASPFSSVSSAVAPSGSSILHSPTSSQAPTGFLTTTGIASGIFATGTAYTSLASSSSFGTCPNLTASTSYITVTAAVTSTTILIVGPVTASAPSGSSGFPTASLFNSTGIYTYSSWNASSSAFGSGTVGPVSTTSALYRNSSSFAFGTGTASSIVKSSATYTNSSILASSTSFKSSPPTTTPSVNSTSTPCNTTSLTSPTSVSYTSTSISLFLNTTSLGPIGITTSCDETTPIVVSTSTSYTNTSLPTSTLSPNTTTAIGEPVTASTPCDEKTPLSPIISIPSTNNIPTIPSSTISAQTTNTQYPNATTTKTVSTFSTFTISTLTSTLPLPITINTGTDLHPTTSYTPTTTITSSLPTGTPNPEALHCGLHGLPVGDYFLAEFVENKSNVDVTLEGCYEFCAGIYGIDMGCESYQFYPEGGTGAPRCDLYGGSVAQSLDSINDYVPNIWYDLGCGNPSSSS